MGILEGGRTTPDAARGDARLAGRAPLAPPVRFTDRVVVTISGVRQPIVAILLLIAFFTVISGKPLDGLLLTVVATALAWDAGLAARTAAAARSAGQSSPDSSVPDAAQPSAWRLRAGRPGARRTAIGLGAAVIYSLTVGSFTRYSWPATAGVIGLGAGVVIVGWGGPTRRRSTPAKPARAGVLTWGALLMAGGLWELSALLQQPSIETSSYAHPTISTLTDPLLGSSPGRAVALLAWIGLGVFLVER